MPTKNSTHTVTSSKTPTQRRRTPTISKTLNGFQDFIIEYGVIALAIGFVFGAQVKTVVDSFIAGFVNPIVGILLPGKGTLAQKTFVYHHAGKATTFGWGAFVSSLLSFIIIALILYAVVKILRLDKLKAQS